MFELHKLQREIKVHGKEYVIYRNVLNDEKEPTGEIEEITALCGLFHTTKSYITRNSSESGITRSKGQPMILACYDNTLNINQGDFVIINNKRYNIIENNNVEEYNIVCDISLEVVLNGNN